MSSAANFTFMSHPALFKGKHFQPEIILLNVRWYCRYALSYRNLEEMMADKDSRLTTAQSIVGSCSMDRN